MFLIFQETNTSKGEELEGRFLIAQVANYVCCTVEDVQDRQYIVVKVKDASSIVEIGHMVMVKLVGMVSTR